MFCGVVDMTAQIVQYYWFRRWDPLRSSLLSLLWRSDCNLSSFHLTVLSSYKRRTLCELNSIIYRSRFRFSSCCNDESFCPKSKEISEIVYLGVLYDWLKLIVINYKCCSDNLLRKLFAGLFRRPGYHLNGVPPVAQTKSVVFLFCFTSSWYATSKILVCFFLASTSLFCLYLDY